MNTNNTSGHQILFCVITEDSLEVKVCKILAYALLLAFSLLGNGCLSRSQHEDNYFLIVNMAVSDRLVPVFAMPRACVEIFNGNLRWLIGGALGETLCKLTAFLQDISTAVSVQSLVAISVDRFYAVWFPLKAARTKPRMKCVISLVWLTSALIHLPYLYAFNIVTVSGDKTYCFVGWPRPVTKVVFLLLIFLILIIPLGSSQHCTH